MEKSMSRMLVETVVKKALKNIKESPERGIRNLVDMALQFSKGRFQQNFFAAAQTMLQNENSAYYILVRDVVAHTDSKRLFTFGMNVGYNGCTAGADIIRRNEETMHCNIPWTISLELDAECFEEKEDHYHNLICEGETLGIYTWMLFAPENPQNALALAKEHPDSAFCVFCDAEDLTEAVLDEAAELYHVMLVIRYDDNITDLCSTLRKRELLYSVWYRYGQKDTEIIINGDLFASTQQITPVFTALIPEKNCPEEVQRLAYQAVTQARAEQSYCTVAWDIQGDHRLIDTIISGDPCCVYFNKNGDLCDWKKTIDCKNHNLFRCSLTDILLEAFPKKQGAIK